MADLFVIQELQDELVTEGIGQLPATSPTTVRASVWLQPRDGAPEPRSGENVTITLIPVSAVPPDPFEGFLERQVIDVVVRARKREQGETVHRRVREILNDRREWTMGALRVEWSSLVAGMGPVTSDETSYTTRETYEIAARAKSLLGLPYA